MVIAGRTIAVSDRRETRIQIVVLLSLSDIAFIFLIKSDRKMKYSKKKEKGPEKNRKSFLNKTERSIIYT